MYLVSYVSPVIQQNYLVTNKTRPKLNCTKKTTFFQWLNIYEIYTDFQEMLNIASYLNLNLCLQKKVP